KYFCRQGSSIFIVPPEKNSRIFYYKKSPYTSKFFDFKRISLQNNAYSSLLSKNGKSRANSRIFAST
ncbi:hypothetical protein CH375_18920, partial [Leptospira ellisii]